MTLHSMNDLARKARLLPDPTKLVYVVPGLSWVHQRVKSCSSDTVGSSTCSPQRTRSSSTAFATRASAHVIFFRSLREGLVNPHKTGGTLSSGLV